ncbi:MAG: ATP-dependent DNA ligase [Candidatus Micrarchaeia archaeon]
MLFREMARAFERIEATTLRLEITAILAELFKKASAGEIDKMIYLSQGMVAPPFEGIDMGLGEKFVEQTIALASGYAVREVEALYRKEGDLGKVAEKLLAEKKQAALAREELTVERVHAGLVRIAKASGEGSQEFKIKALAELLNNASPLEARYLARIPLDQLRLGVRDPTILDALSYWAKGDKSFREGLERAYNLCSDLGMVARKLFEEGEKGIAEFRMAVFKPVRPALAERLPTAEEILERMGVASVEAKYDGFRMQVHKSGGRVEVFSRKLERTTHMFPEIVEAVKKQVKANEAIFEGEALAFNETTGEYLPFQMTIQRKRKYGVREMAEAYPLRLFAFDLLYADGRDLTREAYEARRRKLEKLIGEGETIRLAEALVTSEAKKLEEYFEECVARGLEGVIAKDLRAPYVAGARKFAWVKLKRSYRGELSDTIDVVIVGYYLGRGRRAKFEFGGILGAVYEPESGAFKTVTRVGSGYSEEELEKLREMLEKTVVKQKPAGVDSLYEPDYWVRPKYVVSVRADEITRSPLHTCGKTGEAPGYALRFPRMVELRADKAPEDATTVEEVVRMYEMQKRRAVEEAV